jgi:predicted RNA binding protein YcfA (HicA-like mRNA interferase family)
MPRDLSSRDVAELLQRIGIAFKRHGKEDIYEGYFRGRTRVVIVPRNKRSIPKGTLASILRQAGITGREVEKLIEGKDLD